MSYFTFEVTKRCVVTVEASSIEEAEKLVDQQDGCGEINWHKAEATLDLIEKTNSAP